MFASICRRRLPFRIHQIPGGGTNPLHSISGTIPPAHNSYSSSAVDDVPNSEPCPDIVSYLISCGLSPAAAIGTATTHHRVRIRSTDKADAVRDLLRHYGFSDAHIARTVRSAPILLAVDPERILRPKLDFFVSLGFEPRKFASAPFVLGRSLDKHLVPCIQFLRDIIGSDDDLCTALARSTRTLMVDLDKYMRPAVEALRRAGLAEAAISKLLVIQLGVLALSPDRISKAFEDLKEIGMCIEDSRFLYCLGAMCVAKRETWMRKLALYRSFGLSEGEVLNAFKTQPTILFLAEESIKMKVRFFLEELKLGIHGVMAQPVILAYSLEKCILPRCAVLSVLMREGKIQRDIKLLPALLGTSKRFSTRYVLRHADDVPDVLKAYEGLLSHF
uniref:Uncharacterized protein n=2 Tax=Avena sativa TaxID=4498 RepID=A0ACD5TL93_AVESA